MAETPETQAPPAPNKKPRLENLDGLKGLCGVWVVIFHFLLAFAPFGYTGYGSGVDAADAAQVYFGSFPYSIFMEGPFVLFTFFALISFIPAYLVIQRQNAEFLAKQAITRYFRLAPATLAAALWGYAAFCLCHPLHAAFNDAMHLPWMQALYVTDLSFCGALYSGLVGSLFFADGQYNSVLWCMCIVFVGSYLTYGVLYMFGRLRRRWIIYLALLAVCFATPQYTPFLAGIAAADYCAGTAEKKACEPCCLCLMLLGMLIGKWPSAHYAAWVPPFLMYGVGNFFFLMGFVRSRIMTRIFTCGFAKHLGKLSFALILTHFPVLLYFASWLFLQLTSGGMGRAAAIALTLAASLPVIYLVSLVFHLVVEKPCTPLCNAVFNFFRKPDTAK